MGTWIGGESPLRSELVATASQRRLHAGIGVERRPCPGDAARPCGEEACRRAAAPNESEASYRPGRSGERAKERDAQNPTEIGAVLRTGAAAHPVSFPWESGRGPRERWAERRQRHPANGHAEVGSLRSSNEAGESR